MSLSTTRLSHFLALADRPIEPGSFGGEDVRYCPEYEAIEHELAKATSLHAAAAIDWQEVLDASETLLRERSKDLRLATWLTWALQQCESFNGLAAGLAMLVRLCEAHWEALHPRKLRTRAAALTWLVTRLDSLLAQQFAVAEQLAAFRQIAESLQRLDVCLGHSLGDQAPLLLPLCRRIEQRTLQATEEQPRPGPVDTVVKHVRQATTQLLSPAPGIENEKDAHRALRTLQDGARPLCAWWLKQRATDPRALRLSRTLLWLPIDSLPGHDAEKLTTLRGLPADRVAVYRERFELGHHADLLVDLENSLTRAPFWFDGQHLAWECLQAMAAERAQREVEIQLALLLQRLPGMVELRFHDGSPFAASHTRCWIDSHVLPHLEMPRQTAQAPAATERAQEDEAFRQALTMLDQQGLKPAIRHLRQASQALEGGRDRFFRQFDAARLCYQARRFDLARIQLEALDRQLHDTDLHRWEPAVALDVLRLLHACYEGLPQNHDVREHRGELYRRLCQLDLDSVLDHPPMP